MRIVLLGLFLIAISSYVKAQHTVVLTDGQKLEGVVFGLENEMLSISINYKMRQIPIKNVSSIFFQEYVPYDGSMSEDIPEQSVKSGQYNIKYKLKDRKMVEVPKLALGREDHGTVVVKIRVNKNGNVISAEPGQPGSTTSSAYLYTKSQFAAQSAKFSRGTTGPVEQDGVFTIEW